MPCPKTVTYSVFHKFLGENWYNNWINLTICLKASCRLSSPLIRDGPAGAFEQKHTVSEESKQPSLTDN